jgi:hypothetical protein
MIKKLRSFSLIGGLIVLAALFVFNGCSNNAPMQPNLPQSSDLSRLIAMGGLPESTQSITDATVIDAGCGGVVEIERETYMHRLEVDAGAIDEDTEITVESYEGKIGARDAIIFDFGPDGLIFKKAATLKFEMAELNDKASAAKLHYFDPDLSMWVLQKSSQVKNGVAEFPIYHFSKYAISD